MTVLFLSTELRAPLFVISTNVEKSRSVSDGQKGIDRAIQSDFSTALEMTGLFLSTELRAPLLSFRLYPLLSFRPTWRNLGA